MHAEIPTCLEVEQQQSLYPFHSNVKSLQTTIVHFQLRNLLWATTGHDIYAVNQNCVKHTNVLTEKTTCVLDLSGQSHESVRQVHVATACAGHGLVVAGAYLTSTTYSNMHEPPSKYCRLFLFFSMYKQCK
jgi:hypothetical protein